MHACPLLACVGMGGADHGLLIVVGFDAPDEIRLTCCQGFHQRVEGLTELAGQRGNSLLAVVCLLLQTKHRKFSLTNTKSGFGYKDRVMVSNQGFGPGLGFQAWNRALEVSISNYFEIAFKV